MAMINPYVPQIKTATVPGSPSTGPSTLGVRVTSVDPTAVPPIAIAQDPAGRQIPVRIDMQRGRGSIPRAGERWIIDQHLGFWSFVAIQNAVADGTGSAGDITAVQGLSEALGDHDDALATHDARLDTMWQQATVVAATATSADVQLADGTIQAGAQPVSSYTPTVGDTVWTSTVDAAGSRVVLGTAASTGSTQTMGDLTITDYGITTPRMSNWWLKLIADRRITPTPGFPVQGISMFHTDGNGGRLVNVQLDFVQGGAASNPTMLIKNDYHDTGMLWGDRAIYFTNAANTGRSAVWASAFGASDGGGIGMGADPNGNPAIVMTGSNFSIVGGNDGSIHIADAGNTRYADLRAAGIAASTGLSTGGPFAVAGQTTFNGGVVGHQGASFDGLPLRAASLGVGGWNPALNQIQTTDETVNGNLAVVGTFYYHNVAQPVAASERDLKDHIENLGDPWGFINSIVPARYTWKDTEHFDERPHVGLYVNEMHEADPDTIVHMPEMPSGTFGVDEDGNPLDEGVERYNANIGRSYEDRAVLAYVVRALQDAHARIKELEAVAADRSAPNE